MVVVTEGWLVRSMVLLAVLLALAAAAVVVGVALWSAAAAWVVGGVLGAAWSVAFFLESPAGERR